MRENIKFKDKVIGYIDHANQIFITHRTRDHIFVKFGNGFGISDTILKELINKDVFNILINFEDQKAYSAPMSKFLTFGQKYSDDGDEQTILPLSYWTVEKGDTW